MAGTRSSQDQLEHLRRQAARCRACDLWEHATQTVFGEGKTGAEIMLVGEQPGDVEDREGRPFVGPAGRLLDETLEEAAIDRRRVYVTNAVKHFRWEARGKRRLHKKPNARQIRACRPWLDEEIEMIDPKIIVCLGATASQTLLGPQFRLTKHRGELIRRDGLPAIMATVHPSAILRAPDEETRREERRRFVADLKKAWNKVAAARVA